MPYTDVLYEVKNQVAWLTINRPDKGNTFRRQTVLEMIQALNEARNDAGVRVVVITGAGDRFFCIGGEKEPHAELRARTEAMCEELKKRGPQALGALKAAFHARHNGVTGLSRLAVDHLVANYYHTEEAKEMGRAFNSKQDPDPTKFHR